MPNREEIYDEVIRQSQDNVKSLNNKLKDFDKLLQDINKSKHQNNKLPKFFDETFKKISNLSESYTEKLGISSGKYLQKNNELFTTKISELNLKIQDIENEISRLEQIDFAKLFMVLRDDLILKVREDINKDLSKFDNKVEVLKNNINHFKTRIVKLKEEITRLENIDIEKHFDKLQKTLSDIFNAINQLNTSFTSVIQTLNKIVQSNSDIQAKVEKNAQEVKNKIDKTSNEISIQIKQQEGEIIKSRKLFNSKIENLELQNQNLIKGFKMNRLIDILGVCIIIIL